MLNTIACAISLLSHVVAASHSDPLFEAMQGNWKGQGFTVQVVSGRKTKLSIDTQSVVEGERLVSRSTVTDTPVDSSGTPVAASKSYQREYWIQAGASEHEYEFGVGQGDQAVVTSKGRFENGVLSVQEIFGGEPPYWLDTKTRLNPGETFTQQTLWHGSARLSETQILFRRQFDVMRQ